MMTSTTLHGCYSEDEGGFVTLDELRERVEDELWPVEREATDEDLASYVQRHGLEPVTECSLCERPLGEHAGPICSTCAGAARAHGRLEQARREWEADGRPD